MVFPRINTWFFNSFLIKAFIFCASVWPMALRRYSFPSILVILELYSLDYLVVPICHPPVSSPSNERDTPFLFCPPYGP
ncbi:uncharacterized protein K444DRAFT_712698 [Hyaloscypha bicolor E]|uniref:Uncharacterized protein n=1 Tax=Hyaloscypha bicolor E TaxID=1095630 RepID=A0A2J6SEH6_9HELO|nr:uncharacterized protein K444DRAFT_712698 [Hyaloscypha bicolor E]PMD49168.1 hypothetical protein K444DRAFT_712698 [Hyaloscypha bicolor E]